MDSERVTQLIEAGLWLKMSGDMEGARRLFERALKLDPENERVKVLLAPESPADVTVRVQIPVGDNPFERPSAIENAPDVTVRVPFPQAPDDHQPDWALAAAMIGSPQPAVSSVSTSSPAVPDSPLSPVPAIAPVSASSLPPRSSPSSVPGLPIPTSTQPQYQTTAQLFQAPTTSPQFRAPTTQFEQTRQPTSTLRFEPPAPAMAPPEPVPVERDGAVVALPGVHEATTAQSAVYVPSHAQGPPALDEGRAPPAPEAPWRPTLPEPPKSGSPSGIRGLLGNAVPSPVPVPEAPDPAWTWSPPRPQREEATQVTAFPEAQHKSRPTNPEDWATQPAAPRPSPGLAPHAQSAWDQKNNPGIKLTSAPSHSEPFELLNERPSAVQARSPVDKKTEVDTLLRGARDLLDLDDHTGAMELITRAQQLTPDAPEVISLKERSERTLLAMFESKLGSLTTTPRVLLKDDEIIWLNLDHRAGFVLAQIDGTVSFDDIFSVSGMSRLDTARILAQLIDEGVISRSGR